MKILYKQNNLKIIIFLIIFILLFFCFIIAIQNPDKYVYFLVPSSKLVIVVSVSGIILFPYMAYIVAGWLIQKKKGLEINQKGIYNGLSFLKEKNIYWEDIEDFIFSDNKKAKRIYIIVKDPKRYIKGADIITRFFFNIEMNHYKTPPIHINTAFLSKDYKDIRESIEEYWSKYKKLDF